MRKPGSTLIIQFIRGTISSGSGERGQEPSARVRRASYGSELSEPRDPTPPPPRGHEVSSPLSALADLSPRRGRALGR